MEPVKTHGKTAWCLTYKVPAALPGSKEGPFLSSAGTSRYFGDINKKKNSHKSIGIAFLAPRGL